MGVCEGPLIKGGRGDGVGVCKAKDHSQRLRLLNQLLCVLRMCTRVGVWVGIECSSSVVHVCRTCPLFLNVMTLLLVMYCATSSYIFFMGYGAIFYFHYCNERLPSS